MVRQLGDFRRAIIANVRCQRGYQHQGALQQLGNTRPPDLDPANTMDVEAAYPVGQQADTLQHIMDNQRLEHVEFEVTRGATDTDGHIVPHDLSAQHRQCLALRRVDFTRHDRAAGFVFRNADFAKSRARTRGEPTDVVGDFHQRDGKRLQRGVNGYQTVVRGQRKANTKTNVARIVKLNSRALAALQAQRQYTQMADGPVFTDPRYGTPWDEERAFRRSFWTPTLKLLGIRYRRPYQMRHTYATAMLMAGMAPAFCARQMGHSVEQFLRTYAKWIDGQRDDLEMSRLESILGDKPGIKTGNSGV